ncbi:hypothetical protein Vretifemale_15914 [Volvox reticuliferus]|nr:hypothetical protein Vretifemale_15914 [Volvox reticuliferus]
MLREVLGDEAAGQRRARRDPNVAVVSEAYPESEYNLNPGAASAGGSAAGTLSIADLLQGLTGKERRQLGAARRLLEKVAGAGDGKGKATGGKGLRPVSVPLPTVVAARQERKAGYEAAAKEVTKWQSIVKANREVPTLRLVSGRDQVPRVTTTAALVAQHTPSADNALEAEVAALLQAAGVANTEAIEEAEEKLALKALSLEEAKERRDRLAKLRALLFYHELKSRRLKAIKSKEYHRHLARAAKRKATKLAAAAAEAGGGDVDAERAAAIEAEFQRAKERLTLRHRNSSRWARRALKRGQVQLDAGTKAALAEQLQLGEQLKRKIEGRKRNGGESDDGSTSASDSDGDGSGDNAPRSGGNGRVRSAALELLAGAGSDMMDLDGENAPKKGLLALPFMKRAMERRRLAAKEEAEQLLRELDEQQFQNDDDDGREKSVAGSEPAGKEAATDMELLESVVGYSVPESSPAVKAVAVGGRRKFGGGAALAAAPATAGADDGGDEGSDIDSDDFEDAEAKAERLGRPSAVAAMAAAVQHPSAGKGKKSQRGSNITHGAGGPPPTAADEADLDAAIAAGAAGCGLLVSSSDAGVDLAVLQQNRDGGTGAINDVDAERIERSRGASTRAAASTSGGAVGILQTVAAHQASLAAGGGRSALFKTTTAIDAAGGSKAAVGTAAGAPYPKFVRAKKFEGARPGYTFKKGPQGLGYYLDAAASAAAGIGAAEGGKGRNNKGKGKQQQQQQQQHGKGSEVRVAGEPTQRQEKQQQADQKGAQQLQKQKGQQKQKEKAGSQRNPQLLGDGGDQEDDDGEDAPIMRPAGADQRDLIRQAFAGDDVEAEFAEEKAAAVAEELPGVDEPSIIPGWGAWASNQRNSKWMQAAKEKAEKKRAEAIKGRKDANLKYVVISEKWDKKSIKYTAPSAPFPFTNPEAYERSIRQPLGREYNPDTAFRDLTRPAVLKQAGVAIAPLRFSASMSKELGKRGKKANAEREARRVFTVAGGSLRRDKK